MTNFTHTCTKLAAAAIATAAVFVIGCADNSIRSAEPISLSAPYNATNTVVWAVVPVSNESGTSAVDELALTDRIVQAIRETEGITSLSTNRVISGLDALGLDTVRTPGEAITLAKLLGADAVVVPVLTSWDPYNPPRIGIDADVFAQSGAMGTPDDPMDPFNLARAVNDRPADAWDPTTPVAVVSLELDGSNGADRLQLRNFAHGRADTQSAAGWRGFVYSMDRFETFAAFTLVRSILESEAARLGENPQDTLLARRDRSFW